MAISIITRTNTIDEWRVQTNQAATSLNNLESGNYTKSNGSLSLSGNSSLIITANGTALQVSNTALFQSNVTIGRDVSIGAQATGVGNVTTGGIITALGPGFAVQVANNALVNTDLQVTRTIYTGNISANGNVTVGLDASVGRILRLSGTGDVLYVNTGIAKVNTATITTLTSSLATVSNAQITQEDVGISTISLGTIITGNVWNLTSTKANVAIANITTGVIITGNVVTLNTNIAYANTVQVVSNTSTTNLVVSQHTQTQTLRTTGVANLGSGLTVTGNTITNNIVNTGHINSTTLRTTGVANVDSGLTVGGRADITGNVVPGNVVTSGLVHAGTIRTTGRADIGGEIVAGAATFSSGSVGGNWSVQGDFTINGNTVYNTNQMVLSVATPNQTTSFSTYRTNNSLSVANSVAQNASVRWNETQKYWDLTTDPANTVYFQILDAGRLTSDLTNTSVTVIATASAANTLNTRIVTANTSMKSYVDANLTLRASSANSYTDTTVSTANTAMKSYVDANLTLRATSANSFTTTSVTNANTSLKSYADATFFAKSGGAIAGDVNITGNLTITGATTYANTTTVQLGDNIITLNADIPVSQSPTENAGIEIARGTSNTVALRWNESTDKWTFTSDGVAYSNIGSDASESYANSAFTKANGAVQTGFTTFTANGTSVTPASNTATFTITNATANGIWIAANNTSKTVDFALQTISTAGTTGTPSAIPSITIDKFGRVTTITTNTIYTANVTESTNALFLTAARVRANVSNTAPINYDSTTGIISHADSGVTATVYGNTIVIPVMSVNSTGHVTAVTNNSIRVGSTTQTGILQLQDVVNSTSTANAATANSVKTAWDYANTKVSSISQGTGVSITGNPFSGYTISTGQNIITTSNVRFASIGVGKAAPTTNASVAIAGDILTDGTVFAAGDVLAYNSSDARLKTNIINIDNPVQKVQQLNGVFYDWTDDYIKNHGGEDGYFIRKHDVGLIAQDLEKVLPELVVDRKDGFKAVKYDKVVALLVEAIKELKFEIDELKRNK
jgi:hypothetical protein